MTREPMQEEGSGGSPPDATMSRFRERVAALIALLVILAALAMMGFAFRYIGDDDRFARAKDLLLIINPVLGVVIGYYFNKVSTEARAEGAESAARGALADARRAADSRDRAEDLARGARAEAEETGRRLDDLSRAAEGVVAQSHTPRSAALAAGEKGQALENALRELEAALARTRRERTA
jgi:hypothetical protein